MPATDDPQSGVIKAFPPARVDRVVRDGEEVRLGNIVLTAMATPGHTLGRDHLALGELRRRRVPADRLCRQPDAGQRHKYRFSDHPAYVAAFRASIAKVPRSPIATSC